MRPRGKWIDAIDPDGRVGDAARQSLEARLSPVIYHLPLAAYHAEQDTEHVHRLRVSTRRAMAALKLYRDWLPRKRKKWVEKRLKMIRRAAGEARDLDVLAERLSREYGHRVAPITANLAERRASVQPAIVRLAERMRRNDRFVRKTAKLLDGIRPPDGRSNGTTELSFRDWAGERLAKVAAKFFAAQPPTDADMAALHRFRIQAKALRYAVELLTAAFDAKLRSTHYPVIEELQERLGKINDHVTARDQLRAWSAEAEDATLRELLCEAAAHEVADLAEELAAFKQWWTPERADALCQGLEGLRKTDASGS